MLRQKLYSVFLSPFFKIWGFLKIIFIACALLKHLKSGRIVGGLAFCRDEGGCGRENIQDHLALIWII